MRTNRSLRALIIRHSLAPAIALGLGGCGGPMNGGPMTGSTNGALTGKVDGESEGQASASGVMGASVSAWKVSGSGSLTAASSANASTDGSGRYKLDLSQALAAGDLVVVQAEHGKSIARALFSGAVAAGGSAQVTPIRVESTAEANVLVDLLARGALPVDMNAATIRATLDDQEAHAIAIAADQKAAIQAAGSVTVARARAFGAMLLADSQKATQAQLDAVAKAAVSAQATLDAKVDAAVAAADVTKAMADYEAVVAKAQADAGLTLQQLSVAASAQADAGASFAINAGADAQAGLRAAIASVKAEALRKSVEAQAALTGAAAGVQSAIKTAGDKLQADVMATATAGAQAKANLEAAFTAYSTAVVMQLQSSLNMVQQQAVSGLIAAGGQAQGKLHDALAGLSAMATAEQNAAATVTAINTFVVSAKSQAALGVLTNAGLGQASAEAMLTILVELAIAAS